MNSLAEVKEFTNLAGELNLCRMFVSLFADFIALGCHPMFDFNLEHLTKCRKWIALAILENCAIDYDSL